MPTLHLLHGFIGSGKTTLARRLEHELPALRITIDEWMIALHGRNPPAADFAARRAAVEDLAWGVAERVLTLGADVIWDAGLWTRAARDEARARAAGAGAVCILHRLEAPRERLLARVLERTAAGDVANLHIDAAAFEALWPGFEPAGDDEI